MPNYFEIHALRYKLWPGQAQFMTISSLTLKCEFNLQSNVPEQMFQIAWDDVLRPPHGCSEDKISSE